MATGTAGRSRQGLWRAIATASVPVMLALWAVWREVLMLDAGGLRHLGGARATLEWLLLSLATLALAALFWLPARPLRVPVYTLYALAVSVAFGVAGVLGVMHGLGGPAGNLAAPRWAIVALVATSLLCVASLLATAALIVEDVRQGDADELLSPPAG